MPADIDQLLDRGAAEPTRPLDVDALRARAGRARRRGRILTGASAVGVLAIAVTVLAGGGDRVELRPGADTAGPALRFAVTATAEPDAALTDVLVEVSDPGEVAVGDAAEHQLTVTPVGRPVTLDGLAHLDQTVRHPNGGALQVLGVCAPGHDTVPTCPDPAELIASADSPRQMPLRLGTDDLTAGTYELAVPLSTADDAAPAPPIHLTYTVTEVTAATDGQDPPPPADPQPDDIALVADPARVPPGATLNLWLRNNSRGVVQYGLEYTLQRWDGRTWTEQPAGGWEDIETPLQLEPGGDSHTQVIQAPDTDGWYRVTRTVQAEDAVDEIVLHARFQVQAALLQPKAGEDHTVLAAAAATHSAAAAGRVALDPDALAEAWDAVEALTGPPSIPAGTGVLVVTVDSSTCRSTTDVLGVEVQGDRAVVVLDADGAFTQACPSVPDLPRGTVYAVAVPADLARTLTEVDTRIEEAPSGASPSNPQP